MSEETITGIIYGIFGVVSLIIFVIRIISTISETSELRQQRRRQRASKKLNENEYRRTGCKKCGCKNVSNRHVTVDGNSWSMLYNGWCNPCVKRYIDESAAAFNAKKKAEEARREAHLRLERDKKIVDHQKTDGLCPKCGSERRSRGTSMSNRGPKWYWKCDNCNYHIGEAPHPYG